MSDRQPAGEAVQRGAVSLAPITLARSITDRHGALAYVDGALAAVLVRLDHDAHEDLQGHWAVEVGFGPFDVVPPPIFRTLGAAGAWLAAVGGAEVQPSACPGLGEAIRDNY